MSRKDVKDPHAIICIRKLLQIIDLGMIEELQEAEETLNVAQNLEIAEDFKTKKGKNFFSRSQEKINKILHKTGSSPIFNHPLTGASIHRISVLIDYLRKHIDAEGIFRISGNKKRQEELKHLLDKDVEIDFDKDNYTEHDVASSLKQFLAELPEPIITSAHVKIHMQIIDIDNTERQIKALQLLFLLIPPENRHLMQQLLELLHDIAENKENKMSAFNLAVVFAPSIMLYKHRSSSCLSAVPEDITTFTAALAFMIDHVQEIFAIPDDLLKEIEEQKSSRNTQDSDTPVASKPFCAQVDPRLYHTSGNKYTANALIDLYTQMSEMEDTPMKQQFLKRFAEFYPGTPPFKPKTKKPPEEEPRTTFTAPKILSPRFRSFSRLPLQAVNSSRSETDSLCDSPTGHFRSFRIPDGECQSQSNTKKPRGNCASQEPATPSGHFLKFTPSGSIRNPFKRKRRTKTIGSSSESDFAKPCTPKPRRTSSSSQFEKSPSFHLRRSASKKTKSTTITPTPVIKKSLIGRDIRSLYITPVNSKNRNFFSSAK